MGKLSKVSIVGLVLILGAIIIYIIYPYFGLPGASNALYYFIFGPMIIILGLVIIFLGFYYRK
ncbi:MAG: hypothetical protein ACFE9Z_10500 [Promethearchaeota archaeon]